MAAPKLTIDATGCHRPTFEEWLNYIVESYKSIYGQDVYLESDSQDGQFISLQAQGHDDDSGAALAVYNSFRPDYAQGAALSSLVKLNGITRHVATYSTSTVRISGVVGTLITNGAVGDANGTSWALPASVTIPPAGWIDVTVTCFEIGDIRAAEGEIDTIVTTVPGWQEAISVADSVPGAPIETDGALRQRYAFSASLPALNSRQGLQAAIAAISGVQRMRIYQNDSPGADSWSIPGHSIAVVIEGGSLQVIADTIGLKKGGGVQTYGTHSLMTTADENDYASRVYFSPVVNVPISYHMVVKAGVGFTTDVRQRIIDSLAAWTNGLGIGTPVQLADAYFAARLYGDADSKTYSIVPGSLMTARDGLLVATQDALMAFNEAPFALASYTWVEVT